MGVAVAGLPTALRRMIIEAGQYAVGAPLAGSATDTTIIIVGADGGAAVDVARKEDVRLVLHCLCRAYAIDRFAVLAHRPAPAATIGVTGIAAVVGATFAWRMAIRRQDRMLACRPATLPDDHWLRRVLPAQPPPPGVAAGMRQVFDLPILRGRVSRGRPTRA